MSRIPPISAGHGDPATDELIAEVDRLFARPWNITRVMANAPAVLSTMRHLWENLSRASLSPLDRETIAMEMAVANGCHYCVPAHRHATRERGLDIIPIEAIASGQTLTEGRSAVIQSLVRRLVATKGKLEDDEFWQFQAGGVTPRQMIETIAEIAHCTVTNYMNGLAETELDEFLEPYR